MNKYVVKVVHVFSNLVEVEASSEEGAREKAMEYISENNDLKNYYEATIPPENWHVIEKEEFDKIKAEVENTIKPKEEKSNIIVP